MSDNNAVKPTVADVLRNVVALQLHDESGEKKYPVLSSLLAPHFDDKGRMTREPGQLSLRIDSGSIRVLVVAPTEGRQTTLEVSSLVGLLEKVEEHVKSTKATWELTWKAKQKQRRGLDRVLE